MKKLIEKARHNHVLMMLVCCIAPLIIVLAAVYYFGLSKSYLFWTVLILCPLMHYFMMRSMHKEDAATKNRKGGCH